MERIDLDGSDSNSVIIIPPEEENSREKPCIFCEQIHRL